MQPQYLRLEKLAHIYKNKLLIKLLLASGAPLDLTTTDADPGNFARRHFASAGCFGSTLHVLTAFSGSGRMQYAPTQVLNPHCTYAGLESTLHVRRS
jgi:hypothetical protein